MTITSAWRSESVIVSAQVLNSSPSFRGWQLLTEGKGGIQAVGLKEFIDWSAQHHQHLEQLCQQLQRGEVPNHVALRATGIGLARAFHRLRS